MDDLSVFNSLDEQTAVRFTGRLNILERISRQMVGLIILKDGEIYRCDFRGSYGLKAFFNITIECAQLIQLDFIVEPEIISDDSREIYLSYEDLKTQSVEAIDKYVQSSTQKPPLSLRLMIRSDFLSPDREELSDTEFRVLCTLTEWSKVEDIYRNCPLQDYEITEALVDLRRKEAIKTIALRSTEQ